MLAIAKAHLLTADLANGEIAIGYDDWPDMQYPGKRHP
jgi:hypothetical protein